MVGSRMIKEQGYIFSRSKYRSENCILRMYNLIHPVERYWYRNEAMQIASSVIPRRNDKEQYLTMLPAPKDKGLLSVLEIQILIGFQTVVVVV